MNASWPYPWAIAALTQAAHATRYVQQRATQVVDKRDRSPVTAADFAAQAVIAASLQTNDASTALVAEEEMATLQAAPPRVQAAVLDAVRQVYPQATWAQVLTWLDQGRGPAQGRFWVLDPVDGTKGFLRGAQYALALALVEEGRVVWGGLACPNLPFPGQTEQIGVLAVAAHGRGTWARPLEDPTHWQRWHVSSVAEPGAARVLRSYEAAHTHGGVIAALTQALGVRQPPLRLDSQAKYALLAAGAGEIYLRVPPAARPDYREKIWDQAAGVLLVQEAGGRVTDLDGRPLDFSQGRTLARNRGVLATNGVLHERVLKALRALGI